jgi:predicted cupin superfamily sugar epimerase
MQDEFYRLVNRLELQPHPEGGYFRETYRSAELLTSLPERFQGPRSCSTAILFLLPHGHISTLHRIRSDEVWHFYQGSPLRVVTLSPDGTRQDYNLGSSLDAGQTFQAVVPAGHWFGAYVDAAEGGSLVGCTVAPGFDFADFEIGTRDALCRLYPQHTELVRQLTHERP